MKKTFSVVLMICFGMILAQPILAQENIFDSGNDIVMSNSSMTWSQAAELINAKRAKHRLPALSAKAIRDFQPYNIGQKSVIPPRFTLIIESFPGSKDVFAWLFHNENRVLNSVYSESIYTGDVFQTNQLKDVDEVLKDAMLSVIKDSIQASKKRFNSGVVKQGDVIEGMGYTDAKGNYIMLGRTLVLPVDRQTGQRPATMPTQEFSVCISDGYIYTVGFVRGVAGNEIIGCNNIALKKKRGSICPILQQAEVEIKLGKVGTAVTPQEDMGGGFDISGVIKFLGRVGEFVIDGSQYVSVGPVAVNSTYAPAGSSGEASNGYHLALDVPLIDGVNSESRASIFTRFTRNEKIYNWLEPVSRWQEFSVGTLFIQDFWVSWGKDMRIFKFYVGLGAAQNWRTNNEVERYPVTTGEAVTGVTLTKYACLEYQVSVPIQNQLFNKTTGSVSFRVFPFKIVKAAVALF